MSLGQSLQWFEKRGWKHEYAYMARIWRLPAAKVPRYLPSVRKRA